jgi:hypothetical protein
LETKRGIVASRFGVFARPTKKEEGKANHVDHGKGLDGAMLLGNICGMVDDANRHRLDAIWGWVGL